jgi:hypothetical protein
MSPQIHFDLLSFLKKVLINNVTEICLILLRKKKEIGRRPIFFKQIGIFRKKGFPYEKFPY